MVFSAVSYVVIDLVDKQESCTTSSLNKCIPAFKYRLSGCLGFVTLLFILSVLLFSSNDHLLAIKYTELLADFDFQCYLLCI